MTAPRPRCSVFIAISVDGHIARADSSIDWLDIVADEGQDYGYKAFFDSCDTIVLGRRTYDTVLGFPSWPYGDKRVIVLTHRPLPALHGETFFDGTPEAVVAELAAAGSKRAYIDGGAVIQQFLAARLIDDLTLSVIPIVLGGGVPLFAGASPEQRLVLLESRAFPKGLVQLRYRVDRA